MGFLPNHADTLFRLARSLATRSDQSDGARLTARISLSKFSWRGVERDGVQCHAKKMYGLIACGAYMIYSERIDSELLAEMLLILGDLTKIRPGKFDFSDDFVLFPQIEKITFALGLVLTDLASLDSPHSGKIMTAATSILSDYLALIASETISVD